MDCCPTSFLTLDLFLENWKIPFHTIPHGKINYIVRLQSNICLAQTNTLSILGLQLGIPALLNELPNACLLYYLKFIIQCIFKMGVPRKVDYGKFFEFYLTQLASWTERNVETNNKYLTKLDVQI